MEKCCRHQTNHHLLFLSPDCELIYFHSEAYNSASEAGINFQDPLLSISWPIEITEVSERDRLHEFIDKDFKGV